jgi:glycosyltransferase involved in cell wall biosynthesis
MMNETPKVSIIINNYNYGRFLAAAIDSALAQSYPSVEVVVVDDGSADDSRATILSYGQRIVPVLKPNGGQASALNAGLERSSGDIIIFLDADDTLHPTIAERVVALFQAAPDVVRVQYRLAATPDGDSKR